MSNPKTHLTRRSVLVAAGGIFALVGAGAAFRVMRMPEKAVAPWSQAQTQTDDVRLYAFQHAILAPNPHNRQPWLIQLVGQDEAVLTCDLARRLQITDPFDRQITIGFGCFIEIASLAASQRGYRLIVTPFPQGADIKSLDQRPLAHLRFVQDAAIKPDDLFGHVLSRRSAKVPFNMEKAISKQDQAMIQALTSSQITLKTMTNHAQVATMRKLTAQAMQLELNTPRTLKESIDLLRVGSAEIEANPDGISLRGPFFEGLSLFGADAVRRDALDTSSSAFQSTSKRYDALFQATPAFVMVMTQNNERLSQIEAGRAYLRFNLVAQSRGLSVHPVSQSLQEYPEMEALFSQIHAISGVNKPQRVQMLARIGYATSVQETPRWPLQSRLVG